VPLLDYHARGGWERAKTPQAYFPGGSTPRHAASALHVHVNTVSQRLERIGSLLGPHWQRPDVALELQLALRLRRLSEAG
jgi:DNA-binding PucR family transcriptional regulator